jgi:hypothetical protein
LRRFETQTSPRFHSEPEFVKSAAMRKAELIVQMNKSQEDIVFAKRVDDEDDGQNQEVSENLSAVSYLLKNFIFVKGYQCVTSLERQCS